MTLTREQVDGWAKLAEQATPGPWFVDAAFPACVMAEADAKWVLWGEIEARSPEERLSNAAFGAATRTAVPALAAEVLAQDDELRRLRARVDRLEATMERTADGVLFVDMPENSPVYCPRCRGEVRQMFDLCYCDFCPNTDSDNAPPLPLSYESCLSAAALAPPADGGDADAAE